MPLVNVIQSFKVSFTTTKLFSCRQFVTLSILDLNYTKRFLIDAKALAKTSSLFVTTDHAYGKCRPTSSLRLMYR